MDWCELNIWSILDKLIIDVIIFVYNEEEFIGLVVVDILKEWVWEVIVCNNVSMDEIKVVVEVGGVIVLD